MIGSTLMLAAALAIAPSDRMAMADRLFNRGDYETAKREYLALENSPDLDQAALLYRLVATGRALKDEALVREKGGLFLSKYPGHEKESQVRFLRALVAGESEKIAELQALDRNGVPNDIRAGALCILGSLLDDPALLERSEKLDPSGAYTSYAKSARATKLMRSDKQSDREEALQIFAILTRSKDAQLAKESQYAAVYLSYTMGRYKETVLLAERFIAAYAGDPREKAVRSMLAMSDYRLGRYAAALDQCKDDTDEWQLLVKASVNERQGNRAEARAAAEKALGAFPNGECHKMLHLIVARLDFADAADAKDAEKVLSAARHVAELSNTSTDRIRLAWALENAGERERAEEEYLAVARDFPNTEAAADALYRRAMSLLRREQWSAAEVALAEALAGGKIPADRLSAANYWRGIAASRIGHMQLAVEMLKKALEGNLSLDEQREARLVIADVDYNEGRREEAINAYADLIRNGAVKRMSAAKVLAVGKLLDGEEARICARALMENSSPEWRQAGYAFLGDLESADSNFAAAEEAYRQCMNEPCKTDVLPHVSLALGLYLVRDGQAAEAREVLIRAIELNKLDNEARASAYIGLAQVERLNGDEQAAKGYATYVVNLFEHTKAAEDAKEFL